MKNTGMIINLNQQMTKKLNKDYYSKTLMKIFKSMKSNDLLIYPTQIIGVNNEYSVYTSVNNVYTGLEEGTWCNISMDNLNIIDKHLINNPDTDILEAMKQFGKEYGIYTIAAGYNSIQNYILHAGQPSIYIEDLKQNEDFISIMNHKAADGAFPFKITREDIIYIYPQLIPVNKPDKISLLLYRINDVSIACFRIDKKICIIDRYISYANLV